MNFETWFSSKSPEIKTNSALAVLKLAEDGSTVAFIARYRKEVTGNLDEVAIKRTIDLRDEWVEIVKRQAFILGEIEHQKKLTPELKEKISKTFDLDILEDLYLPYKQKRKTKATIAKEAGLEPLALWIWNCAHGLEKATQTLDQKIKEFVNKEKEIDEKTAQDGAQDIIIEMLSLNQDLREFVRKSTFEQGFFTSQKGKTPKPNSKFENYFDYKESVTTLLLPQNSHRYLAMRRGWMEEELSLSIGGGPNNPDFHEKLISRFEHEAIKVAGTPGETILKRAALLAYKAHVFTSIDAEVHKAVKKVADEAAIQVFSENVKKLLLAAPFGAKAVLGVDPGIRTGCKLALINDSGEYLASTVMHLQSDGERRQAEKMIGEVIKNGNIRAIAVGNGTAGRETETFIRECLKKIGVNVPVVMVSEAGASVYSASDTAREEFPDLDVTVRGAISIARRLQDPLAELVKVEPQSIGVGQYQHDVPANDLKKKLEFVVDSCVNSVGVNLNTASYHLLAHVSGIGPSLAKTIVQHRTKKGLFKNRKDLLGLPRFSEKIFEQAAGFLKIPGGENPLDNTSVHPEKYPHIEKLALKINKQVKDFIGSGVSLIKGDKEFEKEVGAFTFKDIVSELEKPGRDPREEFVTFQYREDIHEIKDLTPGMVCPGIVTNVTNFGAFVDIGVHQDGLVHISQLSDKFVKDPNEVVSPGDKVQVRVLEINKEKNQIALTMKSGQIRPEARSDSRSTSTGGRPGSSGGGRPSGPAPMNSFNTGALKNNAFAGLANLKKNLKG